RSQGEANVFVVNNGHHDDGNGGGGRISFQQRQGSPAVQAGHHHIKGDDGGLEPFGHLQPDSAVSRDFNVVAVLGQCALHDVPHVGVVVDDENRGLRHAGRGTC